MDLMDVLNYACWIVGGALGYLVARMLGADRVHQVKGLVIGALCGAATFYLALFVLNWWETRAQR
jgi:hypothetical protein